MKCPKVDNQFCVFWIGGECVIKECMDECTGAQPTIGDSLSLRVFKERMSRKEIEDTIAVQEMIIRYAEPNDVGDEDSVEECEGVKVRAVWLRDRLREIVSGRGGK